MKKRILIPSVLWCILVFVVLVTPVSAGLAVTDGVKITARTGNTSPVMTVTDTDIANNGIITIDISPLHGIVANGTFTNANLVVDDNAVNATWTGDVTGDTLTLTATGENTTAGENVIVTFTGAAGSAWMPDTWGGTISGSLTATRTDTGETDYNQLRHRDSSWSGRSHGRKRRKDHRCRWSNIDGVDYHRRSDQSV